MPAGAGQTIAAAVASLEGVPAAPHRSGGAEFLLGKRELGHLHGDSLADLPCHSHAREEGSPEELIAEGRAFPPRFVRDSGWISKPLRSDADVEDAVALFRLAYDRARAAAERREPTGAPA